MGHVFAAQSTRGLIRHRKRGRVKIDDVSQSGADIVTAGATATVACGRATYGADDGDFGSMS